MDGFVAVCAWLREGKRVREGVRGRLKEKERRDRGEANGGGRREQD
jgi:hypothetical protein